MGKAKSNQAGTGRVVDDNPLGRSFVQTSFYTDESVNGGFMRQNGDAFRVSSRSRRCCMEEQVGLPRNPRSPGTKFPSGGTNLPCTTWVLGARAAGTAMEAEGCPVQALVTGPADLA